MTVPTSKRRTEAKVINSVVEYYDSQGDYAPKKWDNPVLHTDSLVELVTVPDTAMVIPDGASACWKMTTQPSLMPMSLEGAG